MSCRRVLRPDSRGWVVLLMLSSAVLLLGTSCASQKHQKAAAVVVYVNQHILSIAPIEARALNRYAAVTGERFESDEVLSQALEEEVIPTYERFYESLREVPIQDPEIGPVHTHYVRSAGLLLEGFRMMLLALEKDDSRLMSAANAKIEQGRLEGERWRAQLQALFEKHGVVEEQ